MLSAARRSIARFTPVALAGLCILFGGAPWGCVPFGAVRAAHSAEAGGGGAVSSASPFSPSPFSPLMASPLERAFSERAGTPLRLFGHDLFGDPGGNAGAGGAAVGAVGGDQILGIGDGLSVTVRGPKPIDGRFVVSNEGQLLLPDLPPINVAGRALDAVREELRRRFADEQVVADVFVYLTEVRRIGVWVVGAVARPGRYELTPFATPLDALFLAGGVRRDGSLRAVTLHRRDAPGARRRIDLYRLLLDDGVEGVADGRSDGEEGGDASGIRLADGDRLLVPPVGAAVAIAGPVKRPGVYELAPDRPEIALDALIALAGGVLRPADHRVLRLSIGADGRETAASPPAADPPPLANGDVVILSPRREDRRGLVHLEGAVVRPGPRALADARTLAGLLSPRDLEPDAYRDFAAVETPSVTGAGGAPTLRAIDPGRLMAGVGDRALSDGERLIVLGAAEIDFLTAEPVLALLRGEPLPPDPVPDSAIDTAADPVRPAGGGQGGGRVCAGLVALARALSADPAGPLANGRTARVAATLVGSRAPCPPLYDAHPDLLVFTLNHAALVRGGVPRPGFYPFVGGAPLDRLDRAAGGAGRARRVGSETAAPGEVAEVTGPWVELLGNVRHPGAVPLTRAPRLRALLDGGRALEPGTYPLMGVIERFSGPGRSRRLLAFSPAEVAAGRANPPLEDRDRVHVFSAARVRAMMEGGDGRKRDGGAGREGKGGEGRDGSGKDGEGSDPAPAIMDGHVVEPPDPAIRAFLAERAVQVRGAVLSPTSLPVAGRASVTALIAAAGGPTPGAASDSGEARSIEVTSPDAVPARRDVTRTEAEGVMVAAGAAIRVNPRPSAVESGAVLITGEVRRPGYYDVLRGEKLSSLIVRAGGLTDEAYPEGTVFLRESAKRRERAALETQARSLERDVIEMLREGESARKEEIALARRLASDLRGVDPPGRIVVEADPLALARHPDRDVTMEAGDRIAVPKRPLTVAVSGEVLAPGSFPFRTGKEAADYLAEAGGVTGRADADRVFVVYPDGRSAPLAISSWNHRVTAIPPGSVVVVPADPLPYGGRELARTVANIMGQIAITAASIAVIGQ